VGDSAVTASLYGGLAYEWENPVVNYAVTAIEERQPPPGMTISFSEGTTVWGMGRILWATGDWVQADVDMDISAIGVQVYGDERIGEVRFLFDGVEIWTGDSKSFWTDGCAYGVYLEITGFDPVPHTLRAEGVKGVHQEGGASVPVGYFGYEPRF
jgi:hypothetical protein